MGNDCSVADVEMEEELEKILETRSPYVFDYEQGLHHSLSIWDLSFIIPFIAGFMYQMIKHILLSRK